MIDFVIDYLDFEAVAALAFNSLDDFAYAMAEANVLDNLSELEWRGKVALCATEKAGK